MLRVLDASPVSRLQTHVVVCGYPRSGSTLLLLIAEACYPHARTYRREKAALNAAKTLVRTRPLMITKRPADLFRVDEIRRFYDTLKTRPRFVLTARDPRAVLTSRYSGEATTHVTRGPDGYVLSVDVWRQWHAHFEYVRQHSDVLVVEFAELVTTPLVIQDRFARFIGWRPATPFDQFTTAMPAGFETRALNGVRPFDVSALDRWRRPAHRRRIQQLLDEMPDLPDLLVRLGYEADHSWASEYRG